MKWTVLSIKYTEVLIGKKYVKVKHVLKRVSDQDRLFLFSSIGHEQVSVWSMLSSDYDKQDYDKAVRSNIVKLKEKVK